MCIALGFWVAAVRIGDRSAWLLLVLLLSLPASYGGGSAEGLFGRGEHPSTAVRRLRGVLQPNGGAGAHALRHRVSGTSCHSIAVFPWLKWIVVGYLLLVAVLVAIAVGALGASPGTGRAS